MIIIILEISLLYLITFQYTNQIGYKEKYQALFKNKICISNNKIFRT